MAELEIAESRRLKGLGERQGKLFSSASRKSCLAEISSLYQGHRGPVKGTLVSRLVERNPQTWVSVSATTRSPRPGEVDGKDYHFLSEEELSRSSKRMAFWNMRLFTGSIMEDTQTLCG